MAPPESVPSATVTDLAAVRESRARDPLEESGEAEGAPRPTRRKPANRRFDKEKVERLKAEISEGRYVIDASSVADRFIEHERNG